MQSNSVDVVGDWPIAPAVDVAPRPIDTARVVLRWVLIGVRVLVALRWPLLAFVPAVLVLGPLFGVVAAGLVVGLGWWQSTWLRAKFEQGFGAAREVVFRSVVWPALCANQMMVETSSRRFRIAKLLKVEFGSGVLWRPSFITVTFRPLSKIPPSGWAGYEPRVRSFLNYKGSTWRTDPNNPNLMSVTVRRSALPEVWALGDQVDEALLAPPVRSLSDAEFVPDAVYVGVGADDAPIYWHPDESGRASLFITGRTGGGKGVLAKTILAYGIRAGWRIRIVNPKSTGEFQWCRAFADHASGVTHTGCMYRMISDFRAEMERRGAVLQHLGVAARDEVPPAVLAEHGMAHRDLLLLDELANLMLTKGQVLVRAPGQKETAKPLDLFPVMVGDISAIVSMGRAVGMSLISMTQHPIVETLGPLGSTLKANMGARVAVGFIEPEAAGGMFGKGDGESVAGLLRGGVPGRAVVQGLATADRAGWRAGQLMFATHAQVAALVDGVEASHPARNYDQDNNDNDERQAA